MRTHRQWWMSGFFVGFVLLMLNGTDKHAFQEIINLLAPFGSASLFWWYKFTKDSSDPNSDWSRIHKAAHNMIFEQGREAERQAIKTNTTSTPLPFASTSIDTEIRPSTDSECRRNHASKGMDFDEMN